MAEYIEREALIAEIQKNINTYWNEGSGGYYLAEDALNESVKTAPAADVVPKSEVERIFADIEKVIGEQYENYVFDNLEIEGVEQDAIIAFADTMKRHFAELKKKYTEGDNG